MPTCARVNQQHRRLLHPRQHHARQVHLWGAVAGGWRQLSAGIACNVVMGWMMEDEDDTPSRSTRRLARSQQVGDDQWRAQHAAAMHWRRWQPQAHAALQQGLPYAWRRAAWAAGMNRCGALCHTSILPPGSTATSASTLAASLVSGQMRSRRSQKRLPSPSLPACSQPSAATFSAWAGQPQPSTSAPKKRSKCYRGEGEGKREDGV